jgi:hypothetical protein
MAYRSAKYRAGMARLSEDLASLGPLNDMEVFTPGDIEERTPESSDYHPQTAPTTAPTAKHKDPRARKIAYSSSAGKLVVRFWDGTWWEYNGVTADTWNELKSSNSTGGFLWNNGFDQRNRSVGLKYPDSGSFNPDEMPPEVRVLFNEN